MKHIGTILIALILFVFITNVLFLNSLHQDQQLPQVKKQNPRNQPKINEEKEIHEVLAKNENSGDIITKHEVPTSLFYQKYLNIDQK